MSTLAVRLDGPGGARDITRLVSNLSFKSVARGGFASVSADFSRALDATLLEPFTDVLVYDVATGLQVGGGRLLDQGRDASQVWQLTALGEGLASMQDANQPYALIDSTDANWIVRRRSTRRLSAGDGRHPDNEDIDGLLMEAAEDKSIANGASIQMINRVLDIGDQQLGCLSLRHTDGAATSNWDVRWGAGSSTFGSGDSNLRAENWAASSTNRARIRHGVEISTGLTVPTITWVRTAATGNASENTWSLVRDAIVQAAVYGTDRNYRPASWYNTDYVLAHEVFIDLVARFCPRLDLAGAVIDTTPAHQFQQLAWVDGVTPMAVMEDVLETEQAYTWAVWERTPAGWATEFRALPTDVRYEISAQDGFSGPAPFAEVYDRVYVRGKNRRGREASIVRTRDVQALTAAGIHRTATLDLGDEVFTTSTATKRGDAFLAAHSTPPNSGAVTIGRRVYDRHTERWVKPFEIRPGYLCRVRGVQPSADSLNPDAPNGSTVFSIESNEYSDVAGTSVLELDAYTLTERRAIANLARRRKRKR